MRESTRTGPAQQSCTAEQERRRQIHTDLVAVERQLVEYRGHSVKDRDFAEEVPGLIWSVRVLIGCVRSFCPPDPAL
jgi:hypothetical protein